LPNWTGQPRRCPCTLKGTLVSLADFARKPFAGLRDRGDLFRALSHITIEVDAR
jgi:hypothetical protein